MLDVPDRLGVPGPMDGTGRGAVPGLLNVPALGDIPEMLDIPDRLATFGRDRRPRRVTIPRGGTATAVQARRPPREETEGTEKVQRRLTTGQEYPEAVTWETYEINTFDPQTGELTTEPLGNTELDSLQVQGKTDKRPQAGQAKLGNLVLSNDLQGQLAELVAARTRDAQAEAPFDARLPSDASRRRQLTQPGRFPEQVMWLARNRKTWDPQTGQLTSEMVDDTAMQTVQVQGETTKPPISPDARVGNMRVKSDGKGASVEAVPKRAMSLPKTGLPKAKDAPDGFQRKKGFRGLRGRSRPHKRPEELLTELNGQSGVVEAPIILLR